ncbi:MAG: AAA family ATPase [Lachnospiraceae bacterium]|nr:AAA family ATPase [Lachnospiraceae bacterium]
MNYNMDSVFTDFFTQSGSKPANRNIEATGRDGLNAPGSGSGNNNITGTLQGTAVNANGAAGAVPVTDVKIGTDPSEAFKGLTEKICESVFGQDEFIKKLTIAFKRPLVTEREFHEARNSIYINGPACTGKHYALNLMLDELASRKVIGNTSRCTMDLSIYPTAAEEKMFLQDLYAALQEPGQVIIFENFDKCHVSLLNKLSDLVTEGRCRLNDRYVLANGQLNNVSTSFVGNVVGSFEAAGKYLVFISPLKVEKLAGIMGSNFVNALGDICTTTDLTEESIRKIMGVQSVQLMIKVKSYLKWDVKEDEAYKDYVLKQASRGVGLQGVLDAYKDTVKALSELKLNRDDITATEVLLTMNEDKPAVKVGEEYISFSDILGEGYRGEIESIRNELNKIVGLTEVKKYIDSLEEYFNVQKRRRNEGLKADDINKHMIFTGNPGTGKTTIARIISKYLKAIGVLNGGQLVEVSRADLVGRYVGHTAPLVNQVIDSALGGVLFIDEAYSLYRGGEDNFGLEAIDTLVKGIEDNRDNLIVILAGYSKEMEDFLESNSGLKSRFPNIIDFPDYTGEELCSIADITAQNKGYRIDDSVKPKMLEFFNKVQLFNAREAGNGRLVRNKVEEAILCQSKRLAGMSDGDMSLLLPEDFTLEYSPLTD